MAARSEWTPCLPVHDDAPAPRLSHQVRGEPAEQFHFKNEHGQTLGYVCTFFKSSGEKIQQTLTWCENAQHERAWRWVQFPSLRPLYGLDDLARLPAPHPVILTFECAAAVAAREFMPHYAALAWAGGVRAIADVDFSPLRDRMVWIVPNAGANKARARIAEILKGYGCGVYEVDVPVGADRPEGWTLADAKAAGWTAAMVESLITGNVLPAAILHAERQAEKKTASSNVSGAGEKSSQSGGAPPDDPDDFTLPAIVWRDGQLPLVVDEAESALLKGNVRLFQRTGMVVRVVKREASTVRKFTTPPGSLGLLMVDKSHLVEQLTRVARWQRWDSRKEEYRKINCPEKVAETYLARSGQWKLPTLRAVISTPTLRPDGTILQDPGYDQATQVWYDPLGEKFPRIKDSPTLDDAGQALDVLLAAFKTFPFQDPVDLSVALALALTALVRRSLPSAPLGGLTAPAARSGKTKLADCIAILAMGTPAPAMSYPAKDDEAAKSALALLLDGDAVALIDNITRPLQGDWLCTILTSEEFKQRELGLSRQVRVPTNVLFLATGNHLSIIGDLRARALLCRLDAKVERPEERRFDYDAVDYFLAHRCELIAAGLTIMRAFIAQGVKLDDIEVGPWGGFERWSQMVRAPLVWLGCKDPRLSHQVLMAEDQEHADLMRMVESWEAVFGADGATAREAIARVNNTVTSEVETKLGQVLRDLVKDKAGFIDNQRLGGWMRRHQKQITKGKQIVKAGERDHVVLWKVETVNSS